LDLCTHFLERRGQPDNKEEQIFLAAPYAQSHAPIRDQHEAFGHSVRAMYLYTAMADLAAETGDAALLTACRDLFLDVTQKKMYVTGGLGSTRIGEAFTIPYDLPNAGAYTETCASIGMIFFARRMMLADPEHAAEYADIIELEMYNGALSGVSLDGDEFFYENPLEICRAERHRITGSVDGERWPPSKRVKVFGCSCCPPNLNRVLASLGNYIYGYEDDTVYVNQFAGSEASVGGMRITQKTDFPKSGKIVLQTENIKTLCIRIPAWCKEYTVSAPYTIRNGYAVIENPTGEVTVDLVMKPLLIQSNPEIYENNGKAAVCYGPFVCAGESVDNIENLHSLFIDKTFKATAQYDDTLCGYTLKVKAYRRQATQALYSAYSENFEDFTLNLIPYAAFANRGESNMCVWFGVR
jgi:DUF1680 family protein